MKTLSHEQAFQVLLLQAGDDGRGASLFGESMARTREVSLPFLVGDSFPSVYLEHPLIGEPFLDITLLLGKIELGTRIDSPAAGEHGAMLDWYADARHDNDDICCGFELDTKEEELPQASIHFQPRSHTELVRPFCEAISEPERAELYLNLANRMPSGWPLSFFGMFRGRPGSPLRVCGYLNGDEKKAIAENPSHLASAFEAIGFSSYDDAMLLQASTLMAAAPGSIDFQFDIFPNGELSDIFAIDIQFEIETPEKVLETFRSGAGARVMKLLEGYGAADDRWKQAIQSAFARSIPAERDDGSFGRFAFTLMPQWAKARWANGLMQPSKLYHLASAGFLDTAKS